MTEGVRKVTARAERNEMRANFKFYEVFNVFDSAYDDLIAVYDQLKDKYDLLLTTTDELNEGFTVNCPIIVGKAYGKIIELYDDGIFVLDIMNAEQTMGTHWHPIDVEEAVKNIEDFMNGKSDYKMDMFIKKN